VNQVLIIAVTSAVSYQQGRIEHTDVISGLYHVTDSFIFSCIIKPSYFL
jgi:hypothetical protein